MLLLGAFIKYFIFGDPHSPDHTAALLATERRSRTLAHKRSLLTIRPPSATRVASTSLGTPPPNSTLRSKRSQVLRQPPPLTINTILSKTYYNVHAHQPESLDWFNVLIAQTIAQFRADAQHDGAILTSLSKALNGSSRPSFLDEIKVTELSLGEDFPIFSNCRVIPVDDDGFTSARGAPSGETKRLQARMDVDLSDFITLAIETKLLLNYPQPLSAILPVALAVSVVRFSGTLSISFIPSSTSQGGNSGKTTMAFSFLDDYRLDFSIRSLVGSRSRLQDVPKIASLVEKRLHDWFDERCVEPRFQEIALPSLWPRKKNTRGGGGEETPESVAAGLASTNASMSRKEGKVAAREVEKEIRDEARREVEREAEERAKKEELAVREGERERDRDAGLRRRRGDEYAMPGSMPGIPLG